MHQIKIIPKGLSNFCGTTSFQLNESGMAIETQEVTPSTKVEFEVDSLAAVLAEHAVAVSKIKIIKMDIEGGELNCIADILAFIQEHPSVCACIASYHIIDGQSTAIAIEEKCIPFAQIKCITLWPQHLTTFIVHADNQDVWKQLQL